MLIGYARVSKADGSQSLDLQRDALMAAGVGEDRIYADRASGKKDERPGLEACLKALREGDVLVIWKLDRLGRSLHHLVKTVTELSDLGVGLKVLTGQGAQIDPDLVGAVLGFTPSESRVAMLLAQGHTIANIAAVTGRRESTIRWFVKEILRKLGISRQLELAQLVLSLTDFSRAQG